MKRMLIIGVVAVVIMTLLLGTLGCQGSAGPQGSPGLQGIQGERGSKGDKGEKGDTGAQGIQGPKGEKGNTGSSGGGGYGYPVAGPKGDKGETGISITSAYVDGGGHLILELSDASLIDVGQVRAEQGLIQMGTCDIPFSGGYGDEASQPVSFSSSFTAQPLVFVTITGSAKPASNFSVVATSISPMGFTVKIRNLGIYSGSCTMTVCWLAISS